MFSQSLEVARHLLQGPILASFEQHGRFRPVLRIINQQVFLLVEYALLVPDCMLEESWSDQQLKEIYQEFQALFHGLRLFNTME